MHEKMHWHCSHASTALEHAYGQRSRQHFLLCSPLRSAQAWFPAHAEIWNAPTWFLSALTFAMIVLPHVVRGCGQQAQLGAGGRGWVVTAQKAFCASLAKRLRQMCSHEHLTVQPFAPASHVSAAARHR